MPSYLVTWEIDIEAISLVEAAKEALEIMQDKDSEALYFRVNNYQKTVSVNLFDPEREDF
jgi:predicted solute-binding protein